MVFISKPKNLEKKIVVKNKIMQNASSSLASLVH